ncbi:hypothetical protein [Trinickia mobilis]|uniref:hypothetical protein n=1 Tax=Trinickia mobilis TaxID=2816356 RepID=UPI001A8CD511|nr:hypothetical protein [Trinickia mobilis]
MAGNDEQLPYYTRGLLLPWKWKRNESCTPLNIEEFALASDKLAPPLRDQPPPTPVPEKPRVKPFDLQDIPDAVE